MKQAFHSLLRMTVILILCCQAFSSVPAQAQPPVPPVGTGAASAQGSSGTQAPVPIQAGTLPPGYHYTRTFGETGVPYPAGGQQAYLNRPNGMTMDASGNLYLVESQGNRLWGFNPALPGKLLPWAPYGVAGVPGKPGYDSSVINNPQDVAVGPGGNLWVANWDWITFYDPSSGTVLDNVTQFDANGIPHQDWFSCITGLEIDQDSIPMRLFVAETCGQNDVLVLTVENPYDPETRAITLQSVIRGSFNNPNQVRLADLDGGGTKLYLSFEQGILAFNEDSPLNWSEGAAFRGSPMRGLALREGDAGAIYAAGHAWNGSGVFRCDASLTCNYFIQGNPNNKVDPQVLWDPYGLVFDSSGGLYVSDMQAMTIWYFTVPAGVPETFYGTPFKPYDTPLAPGPDGKYYYNQPGGVAVDAQHNVYIMERPGQRLTKLAPDGSFLWSFGTPGVNAGNDSEQYLNWPEGSPAVDGLGRVYIPDRNNNRIVVLDADGSFLGAIGNQPGINYQFDCPVGVAVGPNGDIFVVDTCANNVQVYSSERFFRSRIGEKWNAGADNSHFNQPAAIAVLDADTVLVADRQNARIQQCTRSYGTPGPLAPNVFDESWTCSTFAGTTFDRQNDRYHFDWLNALAWDANSQRLYVSEDWHNAFKVFDKNAQLIAVVGDENNYGTSNYQFSSVVGLAVDPSGAVYAVDQNNGRVQKYIPALAPVEFAGQVGGMVERVTGDGSYLYASQGARLAVFSLAGPQPERVGLSDLLPGKISADLAVSGDNAYLLTSDNALRVFSLADKAHPLQTGMLPIIQPAGLGVRDGYAFTVSCCGWGDSSWSAPRLYAIDVHDPSNPRVLGWLNLDAFNSTNDWYVEEILVQPVGLDTYQLYLAAHKAGVVRVTFNPTNPPDKVLWDPQAFTDGDWQFTNLALNAAGDTLYAVDHPDGSGSGHLHAINTGNMSGSAQYPSDETSGILRVGSLLYLHNNNNLAIRLIGAPGGIAASYATSSYDENFTQIYASGSRVYAAAGTNGLLTYAVDLMSGTPITRAAHYKTPAGAPGFLMSTGSTLYDSTREGGLRIFDASNPSALAETFQADMGPVDRTTLANIGGQDYLFMLSKVSENLILRVASAAAPATILVTSEGLGPQGSFKGAYAPVVRSGAPNHALVYLPGANGCLYIYDIDFNPPVPALSLVNTPVGLFGHDVNGAALHGNYLLAATDQEGIHIIDVSNPANPVEFDVIKGSAQDIQVVGNTGYFTDSNRGLVVINLADIFAKSYWPELGSFWYPDFAGFLSVRQAGSKVYAYISNGSNRGLRILDASNPASIQPVDLTGPTGGFDLSNALIGNFVFESSIPTGLYAYWAPPISEATLTDTILPLELERHRRGDLPAEWARAYPADPAAHAGLHPQRSAAACRATLDRAYLRGIRPQPADRPAGRRAGRWENLHPDRAVQRARSRRGQRGIAGVVLLGWQPVAQRADQCGESAGAHGQRDPQSLLAVVRVGLAGQHPAHRRADS